jgi:hypothetical protein
MIVMNAAIWEILVGFMFKNTEGISLAESFQRSRGLILDESWANFLRVPWHGIGFGVSQSQYFPFQPEIEPITGLPLGAATEKPNLVVAVLEETGILAGLVFFILILSLIRQLVRHNDIALAWVFFAALFTNVAEMIFFSAAGLGLYIWLMMGWSAFPGHRSDRIPHSKV